MALAVFVSLQFWRLQWVEPPKTEGFTSHHVLSSRDTVSEFSPINRSVVGSARPSLTVADFCTNSEQTAFAKRLSARMHSLSSSRRSSERRSVDQPPSDPGSHEDTASQITSDSPAYSTRSASSGDSGNVGI